MQIIDVINNDISIDENDIYAFMRAYRIRVLIAYVQLIMKA